VTEQPVGEAEEAAPAKPKRASRSRKKAEPDVAVEAVPEPVETVADDVAEPVAAPAKPKRASRSRKAAAADAAAEATLSGDVASGEAVTVAKVGESDIVAIETVAPSTEDGNNVSSEGGERRRGWWQRTFGA
jgi:ribonuclease E